MSQLRRLVLVRHGETEGESSVRFHGSTDVPLSEEGREHMRAAMHQLAREVFDLVVSSPQQRAWESARIVSGGRPVRMEADFREIHFGRWEGLTATEIEASDAALYQQWQERPGPFDFPGGEARADFRKRVLAGLERLEQSGAKSALVVAHKGPIRTLAEHLTDTKLERDVPALGGAVGVSRGSDGVWRLGRRGSDPADLA